MAVGYAIEVLDQIEGDPDFEGDCEDEGAQCDDEGWTLISSGRGVG